MFDTPLPGRRLLGLTTFTFRPRFPRITITLEDPGGVGGGIIGTIFGIWRKITEGPATKADFMQPGKAMVAAGYCLYGSATIVVLSTGHGVNGFMLDPSIGEFILTHPKMRVPEKGKVYSINEGYARFWSKGLTEYIHTRKFPEVSLTAV
ncbi:hypothetical protein Y032_0781g2305 [Ancylostoma ceylanicum]|uniref:fructose-bisphosphatase n=1 Tax=Ancylostoma ceylanicum TaxID=53326 RepID=A0A016WE73_9BILA|nr:hypothetical protein Y032_0781g2305 [Ancylostoma ceylanicum]